MKNTTFAAFMVPFVAVMMTLAFTVAPAGAQMYDRSMWAAPAEAGSTGQEALTQLEHSGIPPYNFGNTGFTNTSQFYYDGNMRYFRNRWSGGGPGVGGDSGLSVLHQFP